MAARLANKTALIAGAAQGIGEGIAETFAETFAAEGARLMLCDIEAGCHRVPSVKRLRASDARPARTPAAP